MPLINMNLLEERRKAVERGYIWSAPSGAISEAIDDIIARRIPMPDPRAIPDAWRAVLIERNGGDLPPYTLPEGRMP